MVDSKEQGKVQSFSFKKEVISIGKKSLTYVLGRALTHAVGFIMIPVYTRFISPGSYGAMEMIGILSTTVMLIISMGVEDGMSRHYYAQKTSERRNEVISTIIIGYALLVIPILVIFFALSGTLSKLILEDPQYILCLEISFVTLWFGLLVEIAYSYIRILYMAKLFVVVTTLQLILGLSLNIYCVVYLKLEILGIFISSLITEGLVGTILALFILRKVGPRVSFPLLWRLIRFGLPLVPSRIGLMLGFMSNRFFLRFMGSPNAATSLVMVGLFSLGHKFGVIVNRFINAPFNSFWGPRRMELILSDAEGAKDTIARICTYSTFLAIYATVGLCSGIESLIEIIADPKYNGAHVVVPFVGLSYVILGMETHFSTGIIYKRRTIWATYASVLAMIVVLLWNYIFVPRYGLIGAATSNLAGFAVRTTVIYKISQKLYYIPFEKKRIMILFMAGFTLYVISQFIVFSNPWFTFAARTGLAALFPVFLFIWGFYRKDELRVLSQYFRKIGHPVTG